MIDCFANQCAYCRSSIVSGQRWIREKIYEPALNGRDPSYHCFHAERLAEQGGSCWEKHEMEREIVRNHRLGRLAGYEPSPSGVSPPAWVTFRNSPNLAKCSACP